ncbi:AAA family ATPase [Vibrio sinaloensis]|uniref:AAA family ATPase n=1 Tax=Photobacterium sp. (strain ATCC 43367) TaxID=379097 RepID=UPI0022AF6B79|nr:AAA family ATPase [Vibrio sinaloensis]MCZ4294508.1 AAA family ATPase [Vibrio sinaloensis]
MLTKFDVQNFRNFGSVPLTVDLISQKNYEFSTHSIDHSVIKHSLVYGRNGSGKSNLGLALLDITSHINIGDVNKSLRNNYLNANIKQNNGEPNGAHFKYEFKFGDDTVSYQYIKKEAQKTLFEGLSINEEIVLTLDRNNDKFFVNLAGTENLSRNVVDTDISAVKYVKSNAVLDPDNKNCQIFKKFIDFVSGMVYFRTLTGNADFYGQALDTDRLSRSIIENDKVSDFENFLNEAGVSCKLGISGNSDDKQIAFEFDNKKIPFSVVASTGTMSLGVFYYWWLKLESNKLTFAYIDEFDAYYHYSLAELLIKRITSTDCQSMITTHNLAIMSNDILRPDCYFVMSDKLYPLYDLIDKDLRKAHNLSKIFKGLDYD